MRRRGFTLIELLVVIAIIAILAAILFPVFARARAKAQQNNCLSNMKQLSLGVLMYVSDYDDVFPWSWSTVAYVNGAQVGGHSYKWDATVYPYVKNVQIYGCPASVSTPVYPAATGWGSDPVVGGCDYNENPCLGAVGGGPGCGTGTVVSCKQSSLYRSSEMIMLKATDQGGWFYTANPDAAASTYTSGDPTLRASYSPDYYWPNIETRHNSGANVSYCDGHAKWLAASKLYSWQAADLVMWNNVP